MSGLITKDLCLALQRKQAIVLFLAITVIMGISSDAAFIMGYGTMLFGIFAISTINYDEFDNGYLFLMTLPITRRLYVQSKYVFCYAAAVLGWVLSAVIALCCSAAKGTLSEVTSSGPEILAFLPAILFMISIMIPIQLKYGSGKSRIAMAVIAGVIAVLAVTAKNVLPAEVLEGTVQSAATVGDWMIVALLAVICLAATAISFMVSVHVMEHKEL